MPSFVQRVFPVAICFAVFPYWDPRHYEPRPRLELALLGWAERVALAAFTNRLVRVLLAFAVLAFAVPYVWFVLLGGHSDHFAALGQAVAA